MIRPDRARGLAWIDPVRGPRPGHGAPAAGLREALAWRWTAEAAEARVDRERIDQDPRASIRARAASRPTAAGSPSRGPSWWARAPPRSRPCRSGSKGRAIRSIPGISPPRTAASCGYGRSRARPASGSISRRTRRCAACPSISPPSPRRPCRFRATLPWSSPGVVPLLIVPREFLKGGTILVETPAGMKALTRPTGLGRLNPSAIESPDAGRSRTDPTTTVPPRRARPDRPRLLLHRARCPAGTHHRADGRRPDARDRPRGPAHDHGRHPRADAQSPPLPGPSRSRPDPSTWTCPRAPRRSAPAATATTSPRSDRVPASRYRRRRAARRAGPARSCSTTSWTRCRSPTGPSCIPIGRGSTSPASHSPGRSRSPPAGVRIDPGRRGWSPTTRKTRPTGPAACSGCGSRAGRRARAMAIADAAVHRLDDRLGRPMPDSLSFAEWFSRWDSGPWPIVVDRLAMSSAGLGPKSSCVPGRSAADRRGPGLGHAPAAWPGDRRR